MSFLAGRILIARYLKHRALPENFQLDYRANKIHRNYLAQRPTVWDRQEAFKPFDEFWESPETKMLFRRLKTGTHDQFHLVEDPGAVAATAARGLIVGLVPIPGKTWIILRLWLMDVDVPDTLDLTLQATVLKRRVHVVLLRTNFFEMWLEMLDWIPKARG